MDSQKELREMGCKWNYWMIIASMAMSFLGTFTTTQVMIQARTSSTFASVLTWITVASVAFGFCSPWSLHFVAMLACELDLPIDLDVGLTILTAVLAVTFTFAGLGIDLLVQSYKRTGHKPSHSSADSSIVRLGPNGKTIDDADMPLLRASLDDDCGHEDHSTNQVFPTLKPTSTISAQTDLNGRSDEGSAFCPNPLRHAQQETAFGTGNLLLRSNNYESEVLRDDSIPSASSDSPRLYDKNRPLRLFEQPDDIFINSMYQPTVHDENALIATYRGLIAGFNIKHLWRGLVWSLSLWCMHYGGLLAMRIPDGYIIFNPIYVGIAELISWVVCIVGSIFMEHIEPFLSQQILFSIVATLGIAAMHFTGMRSATFYSRHPPSNVIGYPSQLPIAIMAIAITTCMLANGLLAHVATTSRNKLAEVMWTRHRLWTMIAQKETAEAAAAARGAFIASASHEIRTPLHHLQGYTDLLSQNDLCDDSRALLQSIQLATRTLSLITNNVLDWSKLESNTDAMCRFINLDIRAVCETIFMLLPHHEHENANVEILLVIAPDVPEMLLLDETYIHRILMNLLSNSLKFTTSGYIMLSIEIQDNTFIAKVRDSGVGIPSTFMPRLFDPFTQAKTRGSQRGTGLGLNIVKKLVEKMGGIIHVESRHNVESSGTTFTVKIPVEASQSQQCKSRTNIDIPAVVLLHRTKGRTLEGLKLAWKLSGFRVIVADSHRNLSNQAFKYICADAEFLEGNPECLRYLVDHDKWPVLVPYTERTALQRLQGSMSAPHLIPISKPLVWHSFEKKVANANLALSTKTPNPGTNLAESTLATLPNGYVNNLNSGKSLLSKTVQVLLVEDNPVGLIHPVFEIGLLTRHQINQKLGKRMLTSLGYSVLLAGDGEEGIQQILKHDTTISIILMDQSMPIKDGVMATREIRDLEAKGRLSKRHHIIACTAVVDTDSRAMFQEAGADHFLAKPLSLGTLDQALMACCT